MRRDITRACIGVMLWFVAIPAMALGLKACSSPAPSTPAVLSTPTIKIAPRSKIAAGVVLSAEYQQNHTCRPVPLTKALSSRDGLRFAPVAPPVKSTRRSVDAFDAAGLQQFPSLDTPMRQWAADSNAACTPAMAVSAGETKSRRA